MGLNHNQGAGLREFSRSLKKFGYRKSQANHTMFIKHTMKETIVAIVYVDHIVVSLENFYYC